MKRKPIPQFEFSFAADAFNMASESTQDGARVAQEQAQAERDRAESSERQAMICDCGKPGQWHGDRRGLRTFCCSECYKATPHDENGNEWPLKTPGLAAGSAWHQWGDR